MVVQRPGQTMQDSDHIIINTCTPNIENVKSLKILGVKIQSNLSVADHINNLVHLSHQNLYALKTLKAHGLSRTHLSTVCQATLVCRLLYACPAWMGYAKSSELDRLQSVINKANKWGFLPNRPQLTDLMDDVDQTLFAKVLANPNHVLHSLLPPEKETPYNLRPKKHNLQLTLNSVAASRNFIVRNLFKSTY